MPVTGCTWRSSPNAPGCWDRGEPPRPVRVGGESPPDSGAQGRRPDPLRPVVAANLGVSPWGPPLSPAWSLLASVWGPAVVVSTPVPAWAVSGAVYCTRVGIYCPGVVRTARRPHLPGVHPTLLQWHPTLVQ